MRISDWGADVGSSDLPASRELARQQDDRGRAHGRVLARAVGAARWTLSNHAPARAQLIEPVRLVPVRAYRQDLAFPGAGGDGKTFELCEYQFERRRPFAFVAADQSLPVEQEAHERRRRHRLEFGALAVTRVAMDACKPAALAPLGVARGDRLRRERAAHDIALLFEIGRAHV